MENLDEAIDKLLGDPGAMSQVMSLARSLGAASPPQEESAPKVSVDARHTALYRAILPYLSPSRSEKLEKAMQLAKLLNLAGIAMSSSRGDD